MMAKHKTKRFKEEFKRTQYY